MLAAGAGTRLRPLTDVLPKPLAPVAGRPVAAHLLERLGALEELDAIGVNLHHGADLVERVLGPGPVYLREDWLRGTAGALAGAAAFLREGGDEFVVTSADGVHEIDVGALIELHRAQGAAATITVKRIARPETCAVVELDGRRVARFVEKPPPDRVFSDLASIGVYCFRVDVLELIPDDRPVDIAGELIPLLLDCGLPVAAYRTDAWWSDIGDAEELLAANLAAAHGEVALRHADAARPDPGVRVYAGSRIAPDARIEAPAVIGPDAAVGAGAIVSGALILPGAEVAPGARVESVVHGDGRDVVRSWLGRG